MSERRPFSVYGFTNVAADLGNCELLSAMKERFIVMYTSVISFIWSAI